MATSQERRWWTEEEDRILRQEAEIQRMEALILSILVFSFFLFFSARTCSSSLSRHYADNCTLVSQCGVRNWNAIAAKLPGRTNKDCRKRWCKLGRNIRIGAWMDARRGYAAAASSRSIWLSVRRDDARRRQKGGWIIHGSLQLDTGS